MVNDRTLPRRLITVPGVVIAFVVVSLGLPLLLATGLLVDLARWVVSRRPAMATRLVAMGSPRYRDGFKLTLQEDLVDLPRAKVLAHAQQRIRTLSSCRAKSEFSDRLLGCYTA